METILRHIVNSISDDNVRYVLLYSKVSCEWTATKEVMCEDRLWHCAWMSDPYPNQYGARRAIAFFCGA